MSRSGRGEPTFEDLTTVSVAWSQSCGTHGRYNFAFRYKPVRWKGWRPQSSCDCDRIFRSIEKLHRTLFFCSALLATAVAFPCSLIAEISFFPLPSPQSTPQAITAGPDGNVWFAEVLGGRIGRITPTGEITEFSLHVQTRKRHHAWSGRELVVHRFGSRWWRIHRPHYAVRRNF
jgi:hypothetical protein